MRPERRIVWISSFALLAALIGCIALAIVSGMLARENVLLLQQVREGVLSMRRLCYFALAGVVVIFITLILGQLQAKSEMSWRRKAAERAKQDEIKYGQLIENARVVMFTSDINGYFTFLSNRVKELTGYGKEALLGKHYDTLVDPEWLPYVMQHYREQVEKDTPDSVITFPIITREGQQKWVEQMAVILHENGMPKGYQCIVRDVSERKRMELELCKLEDHRREYQYHLQAILDNTSSPIFIKDTQGRYLVINKKYAEVLNLPASEILGKDDFQFYAEEEAVRYSESDQWVIAHSRAKELEELLEAASGNRHYIITKFPLFNREGVIYGICGIATDITDRVKYEHELIRARHLAEDAEKLQEQFLANMSHEIRNPLNGIIGMANLLGNTLLNGKQQEFLQAIQESSVNLLVLINDILDFSKIKTGKLILEETTFHPGEVVKRSVYSLSHQADEKGLSIITRIDPSLPAILTGDPHRLNQILVNLIGNAVKFTAQGEVTVSAFCENMNGHTAQVRIDVADTGIGIPEDKLPLLFTVFTQVNANTSRKYGGTGLGLAITKQLVELQNGAITVNSQPGIGSTFSFTIPYTVPEKQAVSEKGNGNTEWSDPQYLNGCTILAAEDNIINQKVILHTLQNAGAIVDIAGNGRDVVRYLRKGKCYHAVLMDIQMPEIDGYETTAIIRQELKLTIPVIAMTATAMKGERERCLEAGMNDYLSKPFIPEDLLRMLYKHIVQLSSGDGAVSNEKSTVSALPYDLNYLEEMNDQAFLLEVLTLFLSTAPETLGNIRESIQQQNWTEAYQYAHKLKTSVGLLRIYPLFEKLSVIETAARNRQDLEALPGIIQEAISLYTPIHQALENESAALRNIECKM